MGIGGGRTESGVVGDLRGVGEDPVGGVFVTVEDEPPTVRSLAGHAGDRSPDQVLGGPFQREVDLDGRSPDGDPLIEASMVVFGELEVTSPPSSVVQRVSWRLVRPPDAPEDAPRQAAKVAGSQPASDRGNRPPSSHQ